MKVNQTKFLTLNALLAAIIVVLSLVPMLGFIQIGPAAIQIISIPVIIGGILLGMKSSVFLSLVFGVSSMFVAMTRGATPIDLLFVNPLVSILPRLIFGLSIVPIYAVIKVALKNEDLATAVTAFLSTLVHSIATLTAIFIALGLQEGNVGISVVTGVIGALISVNILIECVAGVLVATPVVAALKRMR